MPHLEVRSLRKEYGEFVAVESVDFAAGKGQVFGLLGPNGAGKSTAINCICGLLRPTKGSVRILGHDVVTEPKAARRSLGIVPQELALYEDLSGRHNVAYWASAYGLRGGERQRRVDEVLDAVALLDRADDKVSAYSGGMKRRLNFACGIVHRPRVLLLDEPTVAVDPHSRRKLLDLVQAQAEAGTCVLYTTHYMEEAQELCDEIAILDHGKIIADGTLDELRRTTDERDVLTLRGNFPEARVPPILHQLDDAELVRLDEHLLVLALPGASGRLTEVLALLDGDGVSIAEVTLAQPTLESLFLRLTGRQLRA